MTAFAQTVTDAVGISDSRTQAIATDYYVGGYESGGYEDTGTGLAYVATITDGIGIVDAVSRGPMATDAIGLSDVVSYETSSPLGQVRSDAVGISDSISTSTQSPIVSKTDGLGISDFISVVASGTHLLSTYDLRHVNADGSLGEYLPDFSELTFAPVFSDIGACEFNYADNGIDAAVAALEDCEVAVTLNGVEIDDCRFILQDDEGDDVKSGTTKYVGRTAVWVLLSDGVVYPPTGSTTLASDSTFAAATVGTIMRTLIQRAQTRNTMTALDMSSFTDTTDSNGQPWAYQITMSYDVGVNMLQVLQNLVDKGIVEVKTRGRALYLYNPDTMGVDRTTSLEPVIFQRGRDIDEAPSKKTTRELANVILMQGDDNKLTERYDTPSLGQRRRRETFISQGGIADDATLSLLAGLQLGALATPKDQKTPGLKITEEGPQPFLDYGNGDYVLLDLISEPVRYRIRQIAVTLASGESTPKIAAVLNDRIQEAEIRLIRKVNGITSGTVLGVGIPSVDAADTLSPATPTGLVLSSTAYTVQDGNTYSYIQASWTDVITNSDGTALSDFAYYIVAYRNAVSPTWQLVNAPDNFATIGELPTGTLFYVRVQAVDTNGHGSGWGAEVPILTETDDIAPPVPSAPVIDTQTFLGTIRVFWDGRGSQGEAMPPDFNRVEVHMSLSAGFTPTTATMVDYLTTEGGVSSFSSSTTVPTFVKFIAVDNLGNRSTPSAQASGQAVGVVNADLLTDIIDNRLLADNAVDTANIRDLAVGTAQMKDLSVVSAKIANLAVDNAKIASVSVGKLTAGALISDITVSARIKTRDSGARVELNYNGLQAYNTAGQQTIDINGGDGSITIVGLLRTAFSGQRLEMGRINNLNKVIGYSGAAGEYSQPYLAVDSFSGLQGLGLPRALLYSGQIQVGGVPQQDSVLYARAGGGSGFPSTIALRAGVVYLGGDPLMNDSPPLFVKGQQIEATWSSSIWFPGLWWDGLTSAPSQRWRFNVYPLVGSNSAPLGVPLLYDGPGTLGNGSSITNIWSTLCELVIPATPYSKTLMVAATYSLNKSVASDDFQVGLFDGDFVEYGRHTDLDSAAMSGTISSVIKIAANVQQIIRVRAIRVGGTGYGIPSTSSIFQNIRALGIANP